MTRAAGATRASSWRWCRRDPAPVRSLRRALQIVAMIDEHARADDRRRADRARDRAARRVRHGVAARHGLDAYVARSSRSRTRRPSTGCTRRSACRSPARAARGAVHGEPPKLLKEADIRGDLHTPHDLDRRPLQRRGDGPRRPRSRLRLPRDLRPHAGRRRRQGLTGDDVRRQAEEIAAANETCPVPRPARHRVRHPARRPARPPRRRARGARLGQGERARRTADAARRAHRRVLRRSSTPPCAA